MATEERVLFHERQRLPAVALCLIIVIGVGLPLYIAIQQLLLGKPVGSHPMSNGGVAVLVPSLIVAMLALANLNLEIWVYDDRLRLRLFPFADDSFALRRIARWEVREYSPTKEFMGWGIRCGADGTTAYTMKGKRGVQLVLVDGSRVLVGSQHPEHVASALATAVTDVASR